MQAPNARGPTQGRNEGSADSQHPRPLLLHIGDTAGVASILTKYLRSMTGVDSKVVGYRHLDPMGITEFYGGRLYPRSHLTNLRFLAMARRYRAVHVHVHQKAVARLRTLYSRKRIFVHFHGDDVRLAGWGASKEIVGEADAVFYSTPDLASGAPPGAVYLPNAVDTEHFRPSSEGRRGDVALYFVKHQSGEDSGWPHPIAKRLGLTLDVRDRRKQFVNYESFPSFLNRYGYYFDRNYPRSLSLTALQALACGVKVIDWRGEILTEFPAEHSPGSVLERYVSVLKGKGIEIAT